MKTTVTLRIDADLYQKIQKQAKAEHRTISMQAGFLLEKGMYAHAARLDTGAGQARELVDEIEALR